MLLLLLLMLVLLIVIVLLVARLRSPRLLPGEGNEVGPLFAPAVCVVVVEVGRRARVGGFSDPWYLAPATNSDDKVA